MNAIEIRNVTKSFGNFTAVNDLSLSIPENIIFGLLGSNGAGKTTTINMLTGLLLPDSGSIKVLGMDVPEDIEKIRQNISLVPQTISLYENLTVYENLEFFGGLYVDDSAELKQKIDYLIGIFGLEETKDTKIMNLSGGYQRRCSIACSILSFPKILFLDEPSAGVDIHTNKIIMDFIKSMKGVTIILTTHSIKEAEAICDYIVFMDKGQKVLEGVPRQIVKEYSKQAGEIITIEFDISVDVGKVRYYLEKSKFNIKNAKSYGKTVSFITSDLGNSIVEVMDSLKTLKSHIINVDITKLTLEDIFNIVMETKR